MAKTSAFIRAATTLSALATGSALAGDWSVSGLLRQEIAVKTSSELNANNQYGNSYNGVSVANTGLYAPLIPTFTRTMPTRRNDYNAFFTRLELNLDGKLSDAWSVNFKLRGIGDAIGEVDAAFRDVNLYEQAFSSSGSGTPLEVAGQQWMFDLPIAYLDYNRGPLWLRFGNQQIAWGEALFFRVADVPNGLDLRRHATLGVAAEENSDTRIPALGVRGSYRLSGNWDIEAFAQKFQPAILPSQDSPYNPVPAQFTVHERDGYRAVRDEWNFGARLRGSIGRVGVQMFAVRRRNPDGVYRWTLANGATALPGSAFALGGGSGVHSAEEWFQYASNTRLDGLGALETVLNEFPGTVALGANAVATACGAPSAGIGAVRVDRASAACILDTFFAMGDLRGHISRDYPGETVVGFSVNHVFEGEPDSWLDQLIGRFELSYTPDKKFTNPTLSQDYTEKNETQFALILEKYHKFGSGVPATYFVAQWLHKSASDLFGRSLQALNNTPGSVPAGQHHGFNALAFSLQQPSPTLAWRLDFTALTDLKGGWLLQPGVRWKPGSSWQLDVYANVLESTGRQNQRNFMQGLEYADEVFVRGTWTF